MITSEMFKYMQARRVGNTDVIQALPNDPILIQAQQDGYADFNGAAWIGRGKIQRGERRVVRHYDGTVREIVGDE